ncbi:MAG: hypothetical protein FJ403_16885 [Verrucomicrobia bacterium]|nr:hypothetical protein [Verrucomicrobiota bacterium]
MNQREKLLAASVGAIVLMFAGVFGARAVFLKPLREMDKKTAALREKLEKVKSERRAYFDAEDTVKNYAQRAFSDDLDQASAKSGEMLTQQILLSGLEEADFSRMPVGPRKLRGAHEIGWSVNGEGKLENALNLLFLAQKSPHLHRIEGLTISPSETPCQVNVRFRYLTLVMNPPPNVDFLDLQPKLTLDSPERKFFDPIVVRDILRPYVKRGPVAPASTTATAASPPAGPSVLRVVSLSEWIGQPEVHIRDLTNQKTLQYKPGDALGGGTVVMVDYRPLPMPGNEALMSFSRVILKIGADYWAVERGRTLADKYKLPPNKLPEQLMPHSN